MRSGLQQNQFFFGDEVVGYFEDQLPSSAGQYRYMPLRGSGHLHLVQALAGTGSQRCYYVVKGEKYYFIVERMPSLHILEVSV